MSRTVCLDPGAQADIRDAVRHIANRSSPTAAARWHARLGATIARLASDADQWPEADEAAELGVNLRCRLFGRGRHVYRVLFTIDGETVNVHRVRHAAQDRLQPGDV